MDKKITIEKEEHNSNPGEGRTIVHRAYGQEIVLSTSFVEDTFDTMVKILERILDKKVKGGEISYVR